MNVSSVTHLRFKNDHLPPALGDVIISIDELTKPAAFDDDPEAMNRSILNDKWLLGEILYIKRNGNGGNKNKGITFSKAKGESSVSYERMLMLRCLKTTSASSNTFAILLGKGKNSKIYDGFIRVSLM